MANLDPEAVFRDFLTRESKLVGTTHPATPLPAIQLKQARMWQTPSGLYAPGRPTWRLSDDLVKVYITADEVFDAPVPFELVKRIIRHSPQHATATFVATWLGRLESVDVDKRQAEHDFLAYFEGTARLRLTQLLEAERVLLVPQTLLLLQKLSLIIGTDDVNDSENMAHLLPAALLGMASTLSGSTKPGRTIESEVVANHHFNLPLDIQSEAAKFHDRWLGAQAEQSNISLTEEFRHATGVSLLDLTSLCLFIWSHAASGRPHFSEEQLLQVLTSGQVSGLQLISASRQTIRADIVKEDERGGAIDWTFSAFERYPIVKSASNFLVLSPRLLLQRLFGWGPVFDVISALKQRGERTRADRFKGAFERSSEHYARATLISLAPAPAGFQTRVYDESTVLKALGGKGIRTADTVIDYGSRWVVAEISTRRLTRESVSGNHASLEGDVEALVDKVRQIHSTIQRLRTNEEGITGTTKREAARFQPLLIMTESYSVNPVLTSRLLEVLRLKHLLQGQDTAPLEVVDNETLDLIEGYQEAGGPALTEIIEAKQRSLYAQVSVRDYLYGTGARASHSSRVRESSDRLFDLVTTTVSASESDDEERL